MCVIAVVCATVAAFSHIGSLGSALASLLLAAVCIYMGLRKSVLLIFAGGGLLVLAAYHCIRFLLSGQGHIDGLGVLPWIPHHRLR